LLSSVATVTILDDDGTSNQIYRLAWNTIPSPQRTNQPFQVTITAKDATNNTATTFTDTNILRGINIGGTGSQSILTTTSTPSLIIFGLFTLGYEFTPSTNIFVTHIRQYFGQGFDLDGKRIPAGINQC